MVICLGRCADLHMDQLMPLPLTVSCFSKIQIGSGTGSPGNPGQSPDGHKTYVCVFPWTTWIGWYEKVVIILDFNEARGDGWQWHQLDHKYITYTLLQIDDHRRPCQQTSLNFTGQMLFLTPKQPCWSTADELYTLWVKKTKPLYFCL